MEFLKKNIISLVCQNCHSNVSNQRWIYTRTEGIDFISDFSYLHRNKLFCSGPYTEKTAIKSVLEMLV